jgi:hypothetical protein
MHGPGIWNSGLLLAGHLPASCPSSRPAGRATYWLLPLLCVIPPLVLCQSPCTAPPCGQKRGRAVLPPGPRLVGNSQSRLYSCSQTCGLRGSQLLEPRIDDMATNAPTAEWPVCWFVLFHSAPTIGIKSVGSSWDSFPSPEAHWWWPAT